MRHNESALFHAIPQNFSVVRYHSLVVDTPLPDQLEALAWTPNNVLMALQHKTRPLWGIQFHPESVCTQHGTQLIRNFLDLAVRFHASHGRRVSHGPARAMTAGPGKATQGRQPKTNASYKVSYRKLEALFDPESVFMHFFADKDYAFWLGNDVGEETRSRFIFMGAADGPHAEVISYRVKDRSLVVRANGGTTETSESIFDYLARVLKEKGQASEDLPFDFNCGFAGYFGYELKAETGGRQVHASALPDAMFIFCDRMIVFDQSRGNHLSGRIDPRARRNDAPTLVRCGLIRAAEAEPRPRARQNLTLTTAS